MMQPTMFNAAIALVLLVGIMIGLAHVARRAGVPAALRNRRTMAPGGGRLSVRVDRRRMISIVELDGVRFAILTGGHADQLLLVPETAPRNMLS